MVAVKVYFLNWGYRETLLSWEQFPRTPPYSPTPPQSVFTGCLREEVAHMHSELMATVL